MMKLTALGLLLLSLGFTGCESLSDATSGVRETLAKRNEGRSRNYAAPARETYEAVRLAAAHMGYRMVRGGAAQGEFEAVSAVAAGEANRSSRQVAMKVKLSRALDGGTEVTVRFTENIEADSANRAGQATEIPLRDTPQYQVLFRQVQEALSAALRPKA